MSTVATSPKITPLQLWLDAGNVTASWLAVELNLPKATVLTLAKGQTDRIAMDSLRVIRDYTKLNYEQIFCDTSLEAESASEKPFMAGDTRINKMLLAIETHLHQHTQKELQCYIGDDFTCSNELNQHADVTDRCLSFEQMCAINETNKNNLTNALLSATWLNLDGRLVQHCRLLLVHWITVRVDPYGTVTKNYTSLFLRLEKATGDMADDELPKIKRWWWRIPSEFGQPAM